MGMAVVLLTGCGSKVPKLLTPVGEQEDTAIVTRGEMYDVENYESTVTADYQNVKISADAMVGSVDVKIGDKVQSGQVLITMNTNAVGQQVQTVEDQIEKKQRENDYLNDLSEYDIKIAELQLQQAKAGGDTREISSKSSALKKLESSYASQKIEQQKDLAQLQMDKMEGDSTQENVTAPYEGTVCYLYSCKTGDTISAGTVVAVIARDNSKKLFGEYIEKSVLADADRVYAVINEKEYTVTNVPYDQFQLASRTFWDLPLYSTFYFEDDDKIENGMYATIVIESNYVEDALQIPANALYSDNDGYYVYRKKDDKSERVDVKTGVKTKTAVEITEGLEEGEEIYVKP